MAEAKKTKTVKKVTEIPEASVKIEIEQTAEEAEKSDKSADEAKAEISANNADDSDKEIPEQESKDSEEKTEEIEEEKESVIENFDDENSRFSWSKVFLFIVIAAVTGFIIVGVYLFFIEGYNFSLSKGEQANKTIDVEEELSPTPTPDSIDKEAFDITVLNGSGIAGEAASVQELLEDEGFSVYEIGNAETADYTNTQILYSQDVDKEFLDELEKVLETRGPVKTEEAESNQTEDVIVIVGSELSDNAEEKTTPTPELE